MRPASPSAPCEQDQGKGLQPIAFLSKKMIGAETNYPVHDRSCSRSSTRLALAPLPDGRKFP